MYFQHPSWVAPTPGDTLRMLQVLADTTGGEFLRVRRDARLAETFAAILARYRQRHLLSFTPTGVGKRGGQRLHVRLRSRPGTVAAREGDHGQESLMGTALVTRNGCVHLVCGVTWHVTQVSICDMRSILCAAAVNGASSL
ncbi:hypothetical protein LuPra_02504 [Luteitalea pratensis]|uniref:Uncharacterized protein n=1 Tax=Luteitalea pratensis TaxID=1855912 RepID=A0A143PNG2_LUTPR|nr:hypothetical protein LuPra_02504 [Luteitalea pratensis]